jgi:hypothetical protein
VIYKLESYSHLNANSGQLLQSSFIINSFLFCFITMQGLKCITLLNKNALYNCFSSDSHFLLGVISWFTSATSVNFVSVACRPAWVKEVDVSSPGSLQVSQCSLAKCLDYCTRNVDCVGIQYSISTRTCSYFPSSMSDIMKATATPTPSTIQYRLVDSCYSGNFTYSVFRLEHILLRFSPLTW